MLLFDIHFRYIDLIGTFELLIYGSSRPIERRQLLDSCGTDIGKINIKKLLFVFTRKGQVTDI